MKTNLLASLTLLALASLAPAAGTMYLLQGGGRLHTMDPLTAACTEIGDFGVSGVVSLAYDPYSNTVYGASTSTDSLYKVDLVAKTHTLIGSFGASSILMHSITFDTANRELYGVSSDAGNKLYKINTSTGFATPIGISNLSNYATIGYNPDTDKMYRVSDSNTSLYQINRYTGVTSFIGGLVNAPSCSELTYNSDLQKMYMSKLDGEVYTVNLATGVASVVGDTGLFSTLAMVFIPARNYIRGTIDLSDVVSNPTFPRDIRVEVSVDGETYYTHTDVYGSGRYSIAIPAGTTGLVRLHADGSSFLSKTQPLILTGGDATSNFVLTNGDPDFSGEVDAADIDLVISQFGTTDEGDYDVDMSGEVDAADIDIVIANFGATDQ